MIDRNLRALFWQPENVDAADPNFAGSILAIDQQPNKLGFTECTGGLRLRCDRVISDAAAIEGDLVRQQVDNVPPNALAGLPLQPNPNPIGHRAAFLYSYRHNVLVLQSGRPGVSPSLVNSFVRRRLPGHKGFFMNPCLSSDALQRIQKGTPKKVEIKIARPSDIERLEPAHAQLEESIAYLQQMLNGQAVEFVVGREKGVRDGFLDGAKVVELIRWALNKRQHVERAKITIDEETQAIDVFAERLDHRDIVRLDPENIEEAYRQRRIFIKEAFEGQLTALDELYRAPG